MNADFAVSLARIVEDREWLSSMERCALAFSDFRSRLPSIPYAYSRTGLIVKPEYELVAMHWAPGSISPIHDHGASRCWTLMLQGTLDVQNFEREDEASVSRVILHETGTLTLCSGDVDNRLNERELHCVRNTSNESAYTLQLYAKPIHRYSIVDAHTLESRIVTASHDLIIDLT
ncbi:MAG: cysteine dioxygenase family protein [Candidatus Eremiobacteraeota bacterium]|nr:cysteine dioxygenase family protein [Candidatus Eremiobacteraeota bacterium]